MKPFRPKRALLSVSDKSHLIDIAKALQQADIEIIATGGTSAQLKDHAIDHKQVSDITQFPEIMGGRVKTLHPKIHGGILARRGEDDDALVEQQITPIDIVIVNLYPFSQTLKTQGATHQDLIEKIDIGGPCMLRAAAKNYHDVLVIVDPNDYATVIDGLNDPEQLLAKQTRLHFAQKAFSHTAQYDATISAYFRQQDSQLSHEQELFPEHLICQYEKKQTLRYGENPHQRAAFYTDPTNDNPSIATVKQLQGKALSFNNLVDADCAMECVKQFDSAPACVIVKHANPCGVAIGQTLLEAYERAYATDPTAAFGGIIAVNHTLTPETAKAILDNQFVEVIIAPQIDDQALHVLATKENIRVLETGILHGAINNQIDVKQLTGALCMQETDRGVVQVEDLKIVTKRKPTEAEFNDLIFAWKVAKFVKSNAIVYAYAGQTLGIGAGQMSRVAASELGVLQAQRHALSLAPSVVASDAFFPFPDGIVAAANAGCSAVIQPGGSIRDEEVIAAANEHELAMVFTGMRHFRH